MSRSRLLGFLVLAVVRFPRAGSFVDGPGVWPLRFMLSTPSESDGGTKSALVFGAFAPSWLLEIAVDCLKPRGLDGSSITSLLLLSSSTINETRLPRDRLLRTRVLRRAGISGEELLSEESGGNVA